MMPGNGIGKKNTQVRNGLLNELRACRRMVWAAMLHAPLLVGFIFLGTFPCS